MTSSTCETTCQMQNISRSGPIFFFEFVTPIFWERVSLSPQHHSNKTETSPHHNPTSPYSHACCLPSTATSAVNRSPKPLSLANGSNVRCEQGKTAEPDDASNWKMLIVQDGSAHSARALSSTPTATGRAHLAHVGQESQRFLRGRRQPAPRLTRASAHPHLAHPRHGSPALFMLVGDSVLEMRRAQRPEYSLVRGRLLRKSRRFRRHHLWHRGRGSLRFPSWNRRAQRQQSIKAACAAKSSFSQAGPRAVTSPCVSQSSKP